MLEPVPCDQQKILRRARCARGW